VTDVTLQDVRVEREGRVILDVPTLTLGAGRTTAILGPNGSGKTTLLRAIAGLERRRQGRITIGGAPIDLTRDVAYVFQEEVFLRETVRWNLELGLRLRKTNATERRRRVDEAVTLLGIGHLLERRADRVSGGESRRVSLARALCLRAPIVLLDEPLSGLDERAYGRLIDELPRIVDAFQATTVMVTHSRDEALRLAVDLVVIADGRVLASGGTYQVAAHPRLPAVAEVLGYTVLTTPGRRIAVPPGGLRLGRGDPEFAMTIERIVGLAGSTEVVGRIGEAVVRIPMTGTDLRPAVGDCVPFHAAGFSDLD
jgi:putative spermidine/putrescine transport system ATP-binding protein